MMEELTTVEKRIANNKELLLNQLNKAPIIQVACEKTGIGRATYYRWRKEDKEFAESADKAIYEGVQLINDLAESQLLNQIKNGHMTAIIYWLKHRHKAYSTKVELLGELRTVTGELTTEQEDLITKAIKLVAKEGGENDDTQS